jgi:hypothetical protein
MKIDNGTGGSRETSTGKAERVDQRGRESINFLRELKRRNVYKVAVAYAVVAWLLIQVATQVFPFFDLPNWAVQFVVLAMIIGFPKDAKLATRKAGGEVLQPIAKSTADKLPIGDFRFA